VIDWTSVASLATAGGTLVLAVATFAAVADGVVYLAMLVRNVGHRTLEAP
jgi:hypothetical protein